MPRARFRRLTEGRPESTCPGTPMNEETLFHEALARTTRQERERFLDEACAGKPELREAVEALLAAHAGVGEFLKQPVAVLPPDPDSDAPGRDQETADPSRTPDPDPRPADPAGASEAAGTVPDCIGRYRIRRLLGRGSMGAVYLAHDPQLDRAVALKVPKLAGPGAEERFLREARAAAAVSHPRLCAVHDAGRAD